MRLNFIFTGGNFPYMYYRAIKTAVEVHRHDEAVLYFMEEPENRKYFDLLTGLGVELERVENTYDWATGLRNRDEKFFKVNVKDLILWEKAYHNGGIFMDLDTISFKDISDMLGDMDMVIANDAPPELNVLHAYNASIMIAKKGSSLIKHIYDLAVEKAKDPKVIWGGLNCTLVTEVVNNNKDKVYVPEYEVLGGFGANHIINYYKGLVKIPDKCRVLHLFAGAYARYADVPEWDVSAWLKKRGKHYKPMFDYLAENEVKDILEVGTFNGDNAIGMIKTSKAPENTISYTGVDLFKKHSKEQLETELNYGYDDPPKVEEVMDKIQGATLSKVSLYAGDSREILPTMAGKFDFIYIDGGHSVGTIEADWNNAERLLKDGGVVFFDDYFVGRDDIGCKFLYEKNRQKYDAIIYPEVDNYGLFSSKLMSFMPKSAVKKTKKFRFHILGLVHLPTSENYMGCAFTQKNVKMCRMLMNMGHEVFLYGCEGSSAPCTKFIQTHTLEDVRKTWGDGDNRFEIGYDWKNTQFRHDFNEPQKKPVTMKYYQRCIDEINITKKPDDFLMVTQGTYQRPIDKGVGLYLTVESGIGYRGSYTKFRSWESSYIQNFTYGSENPRESINGRYYDRVIPNYFDTKDFPFVDKKDDYFLFMGRMIVRKGVMTAILATQAIGAKLILAGQLSDEISLDTLKKYPHVEFVGYADAKKRAELMGHARAVFAPTIYLEPFCGVHAEAMLCGTPVLTTNFGVFPDTVLDGVNGYKCDTLNDFVQKAKIIGDLDPKKVRETAERFTLESVSKQYQKWFEDLYQVYLSTTDPNIKGWHYIEGQ